jgi:large subunit ribosomal protein L30
VATAVAVVAVVVRVADAVGQAAHAAVRVADAVGSAAVAAAVAVARRPRAPLRRLQLQQEVRQMAATKKAVRLVTAEGSETAAVAAQLAAVEPQETAPVGPALRITLLKSGTGYKYDQKRTLVALGLRRLNMTVERPDNASVRGMLTKVQHLVRVEEIGQS